MTKPTSAKKRLMIALLSGITAGALVISIGAARFVPLAVWDVTALVYVVWVWKTVGRMSAAQTKAHAKTEDPSRALADILLIVASIVSLVAVGLMIMQASNSQGLEKAVEIGLGLVSVVVSWVAVHTTFALRYAGLYYSDPEGGIDFNSSAAPTYTDFMYIAFTVGLTFQVSDTEMQTKELRKTVLKQALLSYLFGSVIIATTINTIASLGK